MRRLPKLLILFVCAATPGAADTASRVADLAPGVPSGVPNLQAAVLNGRLYFAGKDDADLDLWVYDGIDPPTEVPGTGGSAPLSLLAWNDALYFDGRTGSDRELWRYDGLNAGQALALNPGDSSAPEELTVFGDRLCFHATLPMLGQELVCWNGLGPTFDAFDLWSGSPGSSPGKFLVAQDRLYFSATEPATGTEPWSYDSTGSPQLLDDVWLGGSSLPVHFTALGGDLYFIASDLGADFRLYRYDGLNPPAVVAPDIQVTGSIAAFRGRLYVVGHDEALGTADTLWRLDGSTLVPVGGTTPLIFVDSLVAFAEALYFVAGASAADNEIYRYSGVGLPVAVTNFGGQPAEILSSQLVTLEARLYFVARDSTAGAELWSLSSNHIVSDGFDHGDFSGWSVVQP